MSDIPREVLTGHRDELWRFDLLDLDGAPLGTLDGVEGASFDLSVHDTLRAGGSLTFKGAAAPVWHQVMIQPFYVLQTVAGQVEWPVGVFLPATPKADHDDGQRTLAVDLYSKLLILDQDATETTYTVDKGTLVSTAVRDLILSTGETALAVEDSAETLAAPMVWEAGTTKLRIVNDLLDAANFFSLWVDGFGTFRADRYVEPARRGVAWGFLDDDESIYAPSFTHEADTFNVPNKVVQIARGEGDVPAPVATARNEDPSSPWSFQSRGRWITHVETDVEATSAAVLGQIAARRLVELSQVTGTFTIHAAHIPLDLNAAVTLRNEGGAVDVRCVVQKAFISTGVGAGMDLTLRQVM